MAIRKVKSGWYVELRPKGMPGIYKLFATKIEAQRFEIEQKALMKSGAVIVRRTVAEAIQRYLDEITPEHRSHKSEISRFNFFANSFLGLMYVDQVTPNDIELFIRQRKEKVKDGTILREVGMLSALFTHCIRWRYCLSNPTKPAKKPPEPPHRRRRVYSHEIEQILPLLRYREDSPVFLRCQVAAVAFLFGIETGMREGEIFSMTWDNVYLKEGYVHLPRTKNDDWRDVPLSHRAVELIEKMIGFSEIKVFSFAQESTVQVFRLAVKAAGIKDLHFHDSRHEACSRMALLPGMDVIKLAKIIGHRDPRSLMIYFNPTAEELVSVIRG